MKILFVNRLLGIFWGGGESFDYNLAKSLAKRGHTVHILTGKSPFFPLKKRDKQLRIYHIRSLYLRGISYKLAHKLPKIPNALMLLDLRLFEKKAFKWIKTNDNEYDIIQILSMPKLGKRIATLMKKPVSIRFPGPPSDRFDIPIIKQLQSVPFVEFFGHGDTIRHLTGKDIDINDIPWAIDCKLFRKTQTNIRNIFSIRNTDVLLLSCGRIIPGKGFHFLIDGFKGALERHPNMKLMIIGHGPLKRSLEKKISRLGIKNNLIFTGYIPNNELSKYYSAADIFLLVSAYESFGSVILEAMACQLPVIATNTGGIPLYVKESANGFLVNYGDVNALSSKILYMAQDEKIRKKMGAFNRKQIIEKPSWEYSSTELEKLYQKLIRHRDIFLKSI